MEHKLFCVNHPNKYSKRFCRVCESQVCNSCAIDFHHSHIEEVESLNYKYINNPSEFISKFIKETETKLIVKHRCMNFIFHEAFLFCKFCTNFICEKCAVSHIDQFKDHEIVKFSDYFQKLQFKSSILMTVISFQSKDFVDTNQQYLDYTNRISNAYTSFEQQVIAPIFSLKSNIEDTLKLIKNVQFNLFQKVFEYYRKNQKRLLLDPKKVNLFQKSYNSVRFENDKAKIATMLLQFENLINELIGEDEVALYSKLIQEEDNIRSMLSTQFEALMSLSESFNSKFSSHINEFDVKLQSINLCIKDFLRHNLKLRELEAEELIKQSKRQTNYYNQSELNVKNKILLEEYHRTREQLKDQRFNRVEKEIVFSENNIQTVASKKTSIKSLTTAKLPFENEGQYTVGKRTTHMKHIDEKEEVNLSEYERNDLMHNQTVSVGGTNIIPNYDEDFQSFNKQEIEYATELNSEIKYRKKSEALLREFDETTNHLKNESKPESERANQLKDKLRSENFSKIKDHKPNDTSSKEQSIKDSLIRNLENNESTDGFFDSRMISLDNQEIVQSFQPVISKPREKFNEDKELRNLNRDISGLLLRQSNQLVLKTSYLEKISKIQGLITSMSSLKYQDYKDILSSNLSTKELANLEFYAIAQGCKTVFCFNLALKRMFELEFHNFKFNLHHSSISSAPFIYVSGGKDPMTNDESKLFFRMKRDYNESSLFSFEKLAELQNPRHNHSTVIAYKQDVNINSDIFQTEILNIYCISGTKNLTCEKYSPTLNKWESIPSVNISREKAGTAIINSFIYVFLGFDRSTNKFASTFERISLGNLTCWEIITPISSANLLKKYAVGVIFPGNENESHENKILIVGGISNMRTAVKEVCCYDYENNCMNLIKSITLPEADSFSNSLFTVCSYSKSTFMNFSEEFKFVSVDLSNLSLDLD